MSRDAAEPGSPPLLAALYAPDDGEAAHGKMHEEALDAIRHMLEREKVDAMRTYVMDGRAEDALPALVSQLGAQMLVMGALSRRGLERLALGDTAERLIHALPCDLLIIKPESVRVRLGRPEGLPLLFPADTDTFTGLLTAS